MKLLLIAVGQLPMFQGTNTNDFVPFCSTDTGTNLLEQAAYLASPNLPIGNQPGVASSQLVNKALRQATYIASQIAQFISNATNTSVLDAATPTTLLSQMFGAFGFLTPVRTIITATGAGTFNLTYKFKILSGNATATATYSDGTNTFTVVTTITSGIELIATGPSLPIANSGTLSKTGGTGDATITYNAVRAPLYMDVFGVGGGGAGGGCAASGGVQSTAAAGGGGGGSFLKRYLNPSGQYAYVVGTAGVASSGNSAGTGGAATTFNTGAQSAGGGGGGGGAGAAPGTSVFVSGGGAGGTSSGGDENWTGFPGGPGWVLSASQSQAGAGGGSSRSGGTSVIINSPSSAAASGFGGGGSGADNPTSNGAQTGGAGTSGILEITLYFE